MHGPSPSGSPPPHPHRGKPNRGEASTPGLRAGHPRPFHRLALLLILGLACLSAAAVELQASTDRSTTGTFTLSWEGPEGADYRLLQLGDGDDTRLIYQGRDTARVMTGLDNGDYRYRVATGSASSDPIRVTVDHHSLTRAFSFFGIGLAVFLATVVLVVRGEGRS